METVPIILERIENNRRITREIDGELLYEYQKSLLLTLVESGRLTEMQYRYAEEKLRQQRCEFEKNHPAHSQK